MRLGLLGLPFALAVVHQVLFRRLRWRSRRLPGAFLLGSHEGRPAFLAAKPQAPHGAYLILFGLLAASRAGNLMTTEQDRSTQFLGLAVAVFLAARIGGPLFGRPVDRSARTDKNLALGRNDIDGSRAHSRRDGRRRLFPRVGRRGEPFDSGGPS